MRNSGIIVKLITNGYAMMLKKHVLLMGSLSVLLLSSCTNMRAPLASQKFQVRTPMSRQAQLDKIKFWRADGAFSIHEIGQKSEIANYKWEQFGDSNYRLAITSILGLYNVSIHQRKNYVTVWKNGIHVYTAKTPEALMLKTMGWALPVSQLDEWIKGVPANEKKSYYFAKYDMFGHLTVLRQNGWTIKYSSFVTAKNGVDFPQVITMDRSGLSAKIVVKDWILLTYRAPTPDSLTN